MLGNLCAQSDFKERRRYAPALRFVRYHVDPFWAIALTRPMAFVHVGEEGGGATAERLGPQDERVPYVVGWARFAQSTVRCFRRWLCKPADPATAVVRHPGGVSGL